MTDIAVNMLAFIGRARGSRVEPSCFNVSEPSLSMVAGARFGLLWKQPSAVSDDGLLEVLVVAGLGR
jgi:hypothetical protein